MPPPPRSEKTDFFFSQLCCCGRARSSFLLRVKFSRRGTPGTAGDFISRREFFSLPPAGYSFSKGKTPPLLGKTLLPSTGMHHFFPAKGSPFHSYMPLSFFHLDYLFCLRTHKGSLQLLLSETGCPMGCLPLSASPLVHDRTDQCFIPLSLLPFYIKSAPWTILGSRKKTFYSRPPSPCFSSIPLSLFRNISVKMAIFPPTDLRRLVMLCTPPHGKSGMARTPFIFPLLDWESPLLSALVLPFKYNFFGHKRGNKTTIFPKKRGFPLLVNGFTPTPLALSFHYLLFLFFFLPLIRAPGSFRLAFFFSFATSRSFFPMEKREFCP